MPQGALRIDASLPIYSNEVLVRVERINVDSTSFRQLSEISRKDSDLIRKRILEIVRERGKLHNPVTNSGGMLIGRIAEIGPENGRALEFGVGDRVATLVSLTLTPLFLKEITHVDLSTGQLDVEGHALLFETGVACRMPDDLPERVALAVLDICGAPALTLRYAKAGDRVLFLGAGKSAKLSAAGLRKEWGDRVRIDAVDVEPQALEETKHLKLADQVFRADGTRAGDWDIDDAYDLVVSVTNVADAEMAAVRAVRPGGTAIFFGMGTSFPRVALGAEGVGKDAAFVIGNGYVRGHAELALGIVRGNKELKKWFEEKYGG